MIERNRTNDYFSKGGSGEGRDHPARCENIQALSEEIVYLEFVVIVQSSG